MPIFKPQWTELQQYLSLTAAQLSTLESVYNSRMQAEQVVYQQMSEKQRQLNALLEQGSNDVTAIGRLMVDINNLRRQLPLNNGPYRTQALAVLTDAQKAKLPALTDALKLQTPGWQATALNLIDNPISQDPRILPALTMDAVKEGNTLRSVR